MGADPRAAGRKGGLSRSPAKIAAARRNGFQKCGTPEVTTEPTGAAPRKVVLVVASSNHRPPAAPAPVPDALDQTEGGNI
jgi:hypothetical protein